MICIIILIIIRLVYYTHKNIIFQLNNPYISLMFKTYIGIIVTHRVVVIPLAQRLALFYPHLYEESVLLL